MAHQSAIAANDSAGEGAGKRASIGDRAAVPRRIIRIWVRNLLVGLVGVALTYPGSAARARSGTQGAAVSTFDTRASSIALTFQHYTHKLGALNQVTYTSAFSSTSGRLSSQFGFGVVYRTVDGHPTGYGASASAVTLYNIPLGRRADSGLPLTSIAIYAGPVPTFVGGAVFGSLTVPIVFGVGLPISPAQWITIVPYAEVSPSLDFDASTRGDFAITDDNRDKPIEDIVGEAVTWDFGLHLGWRAGLMLSTHLGHHADVNILAGIGNDGAYSQTQWSIGAALLWHWDDLVSGVKRTSKPRRCPPCLIPAGARGPNTGADGYPGSRQPPPRGMHMSAPKVRQKAEKPSAPHPTPLPKPASPTGALR